MKTCLVAVNSKYIHTNLAVWRLKAACSDCGVIEFNINQPPHMALKALIAAAADVYAFSCYIWNAQYIKNLCADLKAAMPGIITIFGGPEVSFGGDESFMSLADHVVRGEGEREFPALLHAIETGKRHIPGSEQSDFKGLPSPYTTEMLEQASGRIVYFESSRGCPFACSFCLSSMDKGVRYLPLDTVKSELSRLVKARVPLVKFVDRTFNSDINRAADIVEYILELGGDTAFHFEIAADIMNPRFLSLLRLAAPGKIQLEAGIQSTNNGVLFNVNRRVDSKKVLQNLKKLRETGNIHLHVDIIAGLPGEDSQSFKTSFDEAYKANPHALQLGFLKLLRGTKLREQASGLGIIYRGYPPYEVISTNDITAEELLHLKDIENVLDIYYNSGRFYYTLKFLNLLIDSPYEFFERLSDQYDFSENIPAGEKYRRIYDFGLNIAKLSQYPQLLDCLKLDYYSSGTRALPPDFLRINITSERRAEFREKIILKFGEQLSIKNNKDFDSRFLCLPLNSYPETGEQGGFTALLCYGDKNPVTGQLRYIMLKDGEF